MVSFLVPSRVLDVTVLNAKHNEVVWAATRVLAEQSAGLQKRCLSGHRHVTRPPCLTVVSCHSNAHRTRAVPHQFLRPWVIVTYTIYSFMFVHNIWNNILLALFKLLEFSLHIKKIQKEKAVYQAWSVITFRPSKE